MREFFTKDETVVFAKALSSELRVEILQYIYKNKGTSLNDLATFFAVSRAAITQNMKILIEADLVDVHQVNGQRDARKACFLKENRFVINLGQHFDADNMYTAEIPIGQYTKYQARPTCGIATSTQLIGAVDDPRYFDDPQRFNAGILWFSSGYIEYRLPNYLQAGHRPIEIQLSMEISSEAPGIAQNWPSDISFFFNDISLGDWTSPGDFGDVRGLYTPDWWTENWNQYGLLKLLSINEQGTFIDGRMISPVNINDLNLNEKSNFQFRLAASADAKNAGGFTLFGRNFGNYNQDIKLHVIYDAGHPGDTNT
jgi:Predicted transcriptional regulator